MQRLEKNQPIGSMAIQRSSGSTLAGMPWFGCPGPAAHGCVHAETVNSCAQRLLELRLLELRLPGHGALKGQHLLTSTRTEGDGA